MKYVGTDKVEISVIVATYKRPKLLDRCLVSLVKQRVSVEDYEIIVADDDPGKSAESVTRELINKYPKRKIKYLYVGGEQNAKARNKAVKKARGVWLAFIDDDAVATPNWVNQIIKTIGVKAWLVLGGPILPYYQTKKPRWFKDRYEIRSHGGKIKSLEPNLYLSASNLVVEKQAFINAHGFDVNLGVSGRHRGFGEEVKLQRVIRSGWGEHIIGYNPGLVVNHLVSENKIHIIYFIRSRFVAGMYHERIFDCQVSTAKAIIKAVVAVLKIILAMFRLVVVGKKSYRHWQNYLIEEVIPNCYELGWFWGKLTWFNQR